PGHPPHPAHGPHPAQAYNTAWGHSPWPPYPRQHPHRAAPAPWGTAQAPPPVVPVPEPEPERHSRAWSAVFGVLAAVLLATAAVRDAGWVLVWTLTGALLLASLAFAVRNPASRRGPVSVLVGSLALLRHLPASPRLLFSPLRSGRARGLVAPAVLTAVVTALLLTVFGVLLAFADPVFANYLARPFENMDLGTVVSRLFGGALSVLFTGSAVLAARRRPAPRYGPVPPPESGPNWPMWVWSIPLGSLIALFTAFVAVQGAVMFGGDDYVQSVTGLIYAEYARQGFFQLVVVSFLVLGVIALTTALVPARERAVRTTRNVLLGLLCLLTLVILASAMMRLQLYIDVFGLTRMRAGAEAWILWSGAVFVLVMVAGLVNTLGRSTAWLPRATVALSAVALAVFAYGNPDLRIAESHQDLDLTTVDTWYLDTLSADAVPGLIELEEDDRVCALLALQDRLEGPDHGGLASWNLSRSQGRRLLAEAGPFDYVDQFNANCIDSYRP
uniref:DUF4153 domain-containing protein n=1 Tax=Nocardiopsis lucentensis TaxID=53441 RepID=UPI001F4CB1F6